MRPLITAQQAAFFTQNGYIELEGLPFDPEALFTAIQSHLQTESSSPISRIPATQLYLLGRDLWRKLPLLQTTLLKTIAPIVSSLTTKTLRLGSDQWIPAGYPWGRMAPFQEFFSIQGLAIGVLFCTKEVSLPTRAPLGLLPLPKNPKSVLFIKPDLLLDWPALERSPATDLYLATFTHQTAVYVHNPKDPLNNQMKQLGYHFGDALQNHTHPLISLHQR